MREISWAILPWALLCMSACSERGTLPRDSGELGSDGSATDGGGFLLDASGLDATLQSDASDNPARDGSSPPPDGGGGSVDGGGGSTDSGGGGGSRVRSTLRVSCDGMMSGRVIVHYNTHLALIFTDPEIPYTSRGTIGFDFPSGFSGPVENPERYEPGRTRYTLSVTDRYFTTYGNHCWPFGTADRSGSAYIEEIRPSEGVVRARFENFEVMNCPSMRGTCVINGEVESEERGIFSTD